MKRSEVYQLAAERIDGGAFWQGCCDQINDIAKGEPCPNPRSKAAIAFTKLFKPCGVEALYWGNGWSEEPKELRQCRVLALLLMSAIAASEERTRGRGGKP